MVLTVGGGDLELHLVAGRQCAVAGVVADEQRLAASDRPPAGAGIAGELLPPGHSGIVITPTRARLGRCFDLRGVYIDCAMPGFRRAPLSSLLDLAWRTAVRVGFPLARIWWRLAHARHEGVAVK